MGHLPSLPYHKICGIIAVVNQALTTVVSDGYSITH
uniref:Uncharacterized protein n=1 Tax=Myoviridae sp. ctRPH1 TaxID=2826650 RepID=A0A8S5MAN0_9CAUD|nr:MAG TPA: hypothetical protein [Myoviridae sp. ctRPH1]